MGGKGESVEVVGDTGAVLGKVWESGHFEGGGATGKVRKTPAGWVISAGREDAGTIGRDGTAPDHDLRIVGAEVHRGGRRVATVPDEAYAAGALALVMLGTPRDAPASPKGSAIPSSPALSAGTSAALLVGLLVLCFGVAAAGGVSTMDGVQTWYPTLDKPPWTPPNWAFGPIWTTLYAAMAIAAWDVGRRGLAEARIPLGLFAIQLLLNAAWSPLFFAAQKTALALGVISLLWVAIAACIVSFWPRSRLAAGLMTPYLLWVSIAWSLNAWIWWFN